MSSDSGKFNVHDVHKEWPYSPKFQDFATFLGIPAHKDAKGIYWREDSKTAKKIEDIYVWTKQKIGSENHSHIKFAIKQLQRGLGTNLKGKELTDKLWSYMKLSRDLALLEQAKSDLEMEMDTLKEKEETDGSTDSTESNSGGTTATDG